MLSYSKNFPYCLRLCFWPGSRMSGSPSSLFVPNRRVPGRGRKLESFAVGCFYIMASDLKKFVVYVMFIWSLESMTRLEF